MTWDFTVDTALIRQAAGMLDDAGHTYRGHDSCEVFRCPLDDASLGPSAAGREVVDAAGRRVIQAVEGAQALGLRVAATADGLRGCAKAFDATESLTGRGPR